MAPNIALLACAVFEREIALWAGNATQIRETRFYEIALHDRPDTLREKLQGEILALDARDDIDAIVLAYGLCGKGTAGLGAGDLWMKCLSARGIASGRSGKAGRGG